jgi:hypothetical protein
MCIFLFFRLNLETQDIERFILCVKNQPVLYDTTLKYYKNLSSKKAKTALERLARGIGGEYIFPRVIQRLPVMLTNPDPDPAVRFSACSAIIQMLRDFYPSLQNNFHQQIIPRLLEIMDDCNGRVQDEGTQAVITFFQNCPKRIAILYVTRITTKLEALGFIGARNKIRSLIGQIAKFMP